MTLAVKDLGLCDYAETCRAMRAFTEDRHARTPDQLWLLEHPPVYTLGLAASRAHLLNTAAIPVLQTDRGGQVTYHGPGQLIAYLLIDLKRRPYAVKKMVALMEQAVLDYLQSFAILARRQPGAPGVYVAGEKIAALGVRVRKGATYHGLSLNVAMDLNPFSGINPCGYAGLGCTQLVRFVDGISLAEVKRQLPAYLIKHLDRPRPLYAARGVETVSHVSG